MNILLTSVFGPFSIDDEFGQKENKMELFHNQVTREQGIFSLRYFHQTFGLHMIAENIQNPATVLDFPSQKRFIKEIQKGYDYIGISFIAPNVKKAAHMAKLIRQHAPQSKIVLGGHGTRVENIDQLVDFDHICSGEGVFWFRKLLGEQVDRPVEHPLVPSSFSNKIMGIPVGSTAGVLLPGVGCPNGCRFCTTSHFFDKKYTPYFNTGKELFDICVRYEQEMGYNDFFVMDENFLKYPERAKELLALMEEHDKQWRFGIFSSAETINDIGVEFMARLGVYFVWIGVESKKDVYEKNSGIEIKPIIKQLRSFGISVLASGILFLEHHDKQTIWEDIDYLLAMESDFVQFMQLGPLPQTSLYKDYKQKGLLRFDMDYSHWHGQYQIWFNHPHFTQPESEEYLIAAFKKDYDQQGSSMLRMMDTVIRGYETLSTYQDPYMKKRAQVQKQWATQYRLLFPSLHRFAHNQYVHALTTFIENKYNQLLGPCTMTQRVMASFAKQLGHLETFKVARGKTNYQPNTHYDCFRQERQKLSQQCKQLSATTEMQLQLDFSQAQLTLALDGVFSNSHSKKLVDSLTAFLKKNQQPLHVLLKASMDSDIKTIQPFLKSLDRYGDDVVIHIENAQLYKQLTQTNPTYLQQLAITLVEAMA